MIWYNDVEHLFNSGNWFKVVPSAGMTTDDKLNAVFRGSLYLATLLILITKDLRYLLIVMIVALITILASQSQQNDRALKEEFLNDNELTANEHGDLRVKPTLQNPFMNVLMSDYTEKPNRPAALNAGVFTNRELEKVDRQIEESFNASLFRDVDDIFERKNSQRQFYTMPSTTIPNDQSSFAEWLYKTGPTFKEQGIKVRGC